MRRRVRKPAQGTAGKGKERQESLAVTATKWNERQSERKGNQERNENDGGQRVHGLPAPRQGARLPGMKERWEMERTLEGRSEGFQPDGVKAQRANEPEAKR